MNFLENLHDINTFIFDVDGVLTDSSVLIRDDGKLYRTMNTKDGFAIKHAVRQGYNFFIISGGKEYGLLNRLKNLGISEENIFLNVQDKLPVLKTLVKNGRIDLSRSSFMGDDIPDYALMRTVLLPTCPSDAVQEIKEISRYISPFEGGKGCARDLISKVLKVQGKWFELDVVG